jgi:hypothetical protein
LFTGKGCFFEAGKTEGNKNAAAVHNGFFHLFIGGVFPLFAGCP